MKTTELMIGDYITLAESLNDEQGPLIFQVVALNCPDEGEALMLLKGEKACDEMEIDDEWSGIPITDAILEQNGFGYKEKDSAMYAHFYPGEPHYCADMDFHIGFASYGVYWAYWLNYHGNSIHGLRFVHELQHAFRILGIEKEVVL